MKTLTDKDILLFYGDWQYTDTLLPNDRHVKRALYLVYRKFVAKPNVTGFYVWFKLLKRALEIAGYTVHVNDFSLAKKNPDFPIGIMGYPHTLKKWSLPNPALLGPGLHDHPSLNPTLMEDERFKKYIVTCQWVYDMFEPVYEAENLGLWHAGIDTDEWVDTRNRPKTNDVIVYDKIHWNRDHYEPHLLHPIFDALTERGLSYEVIRYGSYNYESYKESLARSRAMIFLGEHETQGMGYQEALASNVPLLAWDQGFWLDPQRHKITSEPVRTSSVPYFSEACGETFVGAEDFEQQLDQFWSRLDVYEPRQYVMDELSFEHSADIYTNYYFQLKKQKV